MIAMALTITTRMKRHEYSTSGTPSAPDALVYFSGLSAHELCPFTNQHGPLPDFNRIGAASIAALVFWASPSDVAGLIVARVVYPLKRMLRRWFASYVGQKFHEARESKLNAAPSPVLKTSCLGVIATRFCSMICAVFCGRRSSPGSRFTVRLFGRTSAALARLFHTRYQTFTNNNVKSHAFLASAQPHMTPIILAMPDIAQYQPDPETFTGEIWHIDSLKFWAA